MWFVNWPDGEVANDAPALPPRPCMNWKGSPEEVKDFTSWWWLLLSSENKTLWIGKLAHLIPGGDWLIISIVRTTVVINDNLSPKII